MSNICPRKLLALITVAVAGIVAVNVYGDEKPAPSQVTVSAIAAAAAAKAAAAPVLSADNFVVSRAVPIPERDGSITVQGTVRNNNAGPAVLKLQVVITDKAGKQHIDPRIVRVMTAIEPGKTGTVSTKLSPSLNRVGQTGSFSLMPVGVEDGEKLLAVSNYLDKALAR